MTELLSKRWLVSKSCKALSKRLCTRAGQRKSREVGGSWRMRRQVMESGNTASAVGRLENVATQHAKARPPLLLRTRCSLPKHESRSQRVPRSTSGSSAAMSRRCRYPSRHGQRRNAGSRRANRSCRRRGARLTFPLEATPAGGQPSHTSWSFGQHDIPGLERPAQGASPARSQPKHPTEDNRLQESMSTWVTGLVLAVHVAPRPG